MLLLHECLNVPFSLPPRRLNRISSFPLSLVFLTDLTLYCSAVAFTYPQVEAEFHVSQEVASLGLSLFVLGMGLFPLLVGPLSEWYVLFSPCVDSVLTLHTRRYGRSPVYFIGFGCFTIFQFMSAFANNIACLLIGRFLSGACGSAFLSVAGGSVADLFAPASVGAPMQFYTAGPFLGPVVGPIISGFVNQHLDWRWTWRILIIWAGLEFILLLVFVPETYMQAVLLKKAKRLRKEGRTDVKAPVEVDTRSIAGVIAMSCTRPFRTISFLLLHPSVPR